MSENKAKGIADWFGGLSGNAVKAVKERPNKIQQAEDEAMGVTGDTKAANGETRPSQSKKWTE